MCCLTDEAMLASRSPEWFEQMSWLCRKVYGEGTGSIPARWMVWLYRYIGFDAWQVHA